jgi:GTP-binding protein
MLVDEAIIEVRAGKGGDGFVHFRREKFVPKGGPDGGDGGAGGDVWLVADPTLHTLSEYLRTHRFAAENGEAGRVKKQTGADGADRVLRVLPGTLIFEGEGLAGPWHQVGDLTTVGERLRIAKGGKGGRGNVHFATSTRQTPRIAEKGRPGEQKFLKFELKLLADVGVIGLPNAGKSSLLARITEAKPKVADYAFTTLEPNLGVFNPQKIGIRNSEFGNLVFADIPGLIQGASSGRGLGHQFLRHIERTRVIVHLIDSGHPEPLKAYQEIRDELAKWNAQLAEKPEIVGLTKIELLSDKEQRRLYAKVRRLNPFFISTVTGRGLADLIYGIEKLRSPTLSET